MDKTKKITAIKDRQEEIGEHLKSQEDLDSNIETQFEEVRQNFGKAVELHDKGEYCARGEVYQIV